MATTNIDVNKQNVLDLLKGGKEHRFVIPEYQRPYAWGDDEIVTLFDDLWQFSIERNQQGGPSTYFLGSIVSFENDKKEKEIIDGQQRITSLFLLLRAIYAKLEGEETKSKEVQNFVSKIQPALWLEDELTGEVDKSQILLRSEVVTDQGNEILKQILQNGVAAPKAKDNYSKNFNKFIELYEDKAKTSPNQIYQFIVSILNYAILLPISADNQDTALTIFSTLNNRGLPLSDADIFKSLLYKQLNANDKKVFVEKWKELDTEATNANESIQSLFYYHMFFMRAQEGDDKSTTPGIRKYYMEKNKNRLIPSIIDELISELNLWKVVNSHDTIEGESWSNNMDIVKILDCLTSYTNEFWKYPVQIFYNLYKNDSDFEETFLKFLRKLYVMLLTRYLEVPTLNAVKPDILKLDVQITQSNHPEFSAGFKTKHEGDNADERLCNPHRNVVRMLLKLLAYNQADQTELLPEKWEIEHIFPQKWDTSYFSFDKEDANEKLEHLGNKIPLEKAMNIKASNNYFSTKKVQYKASKIAIANEMGDSAITNWVLSDIERRDKDVSDEISSTLQQWIDDYNPQPLKATAPTPTPEEAEMIRQLKERGLI